MIAKEKFIEASYHKMVDAINKIDQNLIEDIYALSFYNYCVDDDPRYPTISISYNTISNYNENIAMASSPEEAKWNYAFWLQDEIEEIGGEENKLLAEWFKSTPYYYSEKENEKSFDDDDLFEKLLDQGSLFTNEFAEEIILIINRLFKENIIESKFGRNIPVLLHELEYYDVPLNWSIRSNPKGLIDEFVRWVNRFDSAPSSGVIGG